MARSGDTRETATAPPDTGLFRKMAPYHMPSGLKVLPRKVRFHTLRLK
jgi:hypothetical protein